MVRQDAGFAIGVDLGTSNTVAVLRWPDGRTRPLLFDGQPIMPSGVFLDAAGRLHVGRDAQRLAQADPASYEPNPKRRVDEPAILLGDREVPTAELLGALLRAVAQAAVEAVGFLPPAVLTYPATWGARRREVLAAAVGRAGWPPADPLATPTSMSFGALGHTLLVPEPVAAARYFADVLRRPVPVGSAIAVFDFGGGTLDIAMVRNEGVDQAGRSRFAVIGSGGVGELGGLDLDAALVGHLGTLVAATSPQVWQRLTQPETTTQWRDRRQFWDDVRGTKEMLSRASAAPVAVPGVDQALHLTRDELERLITPLLRRGVAEAAGVISRAGLAPQQLAGLFLVGGSSRVPLVARLLHAELGIAPTVLEQPELPVAEGALAELAVVTGALPTGTATPPTGAAPPMGAVPPLGATPPVGAVPPLGAVPPMVAGATVRGAPVAAGMSPPMPMSVPPAAGPKRSLLGRPKMFLTVLGVALALVGVVATAVFYLTRDRYADLAFQPFEEIGRVKTTDEGSALFGTEITGDRAYLAYEREDGRLEVIAVKASTAEVLWRERTDSTSDQWRGILGAQHNAVAVLASESREADLRDLIVLDPTNGRKLWSRGVRGDDSILFFEQVVVLVDRTAGQLIGLNVRTGQQKWSLPNPKDEDGTTGTAVYRVSTAEGLAGPGTRWGNPRDQYRGEEQRIVQIGADRSARVIDSRTGSVLRSSRSVADLDDHVVAHDGRLYVAPNDYGYRLVTYDLDTMGEPKSLYTADDKQRRVEALEPCGQDRVCLLERANADAKTTELVAVSADENVSTWRKSAPAAESIVSIGEHTLIRTSGSEYQSTVFDPDGTQLLARKGNGVRVDGGNLLLFDEDPSDYPTDVGVAGIPLNSKKRIELGRLSGVRSSSCSWNTAVIVCATRAEFVFLRFVEA